MKELRILLTVVAWLFLTVVVGAQNIQVRGTVKDQAGNPIPGASLVLHGNTRVYAMSDATGSFRIMVPETAPLW